MRRAPGRLRLAVLAVFMLGWLAAPDPASARSTPPPVLPPPVPDAVAAAVAEEVTAAGAVLWDPADERVLWGRDETVARPMASTTKIMTVLLAVEAGTLDDQVTVSARAAALGRFPGGASLGLQEDQRLPMRELLAGLMLRSGNDAAVAVAEHVAGSEEAFVERMNDRARALGLEATNFVNASGLTDDPAHHASPLDLARLADVALAHDVIADWVGSQALRTPTFGEIENRNELVGSYPGATGVKTGFTSLAGQCLVASAQRDERHLISVVLGSEAYFADSAVLLDHGFEDYRRLEVDDDTVVGAFRTSAGTAAVVAGAPVALTVPAGLPIEAEVSYDAAVVTAVDAGQVLGTVRVTVDGHVVGQSAAVAATDVERAPARGPGNALEDGLRGLARMRAAPVPTSIESGGART